MVPLSFTMPIDLAATSGGSSGDEPPDAERLKAYASLIKSAASSHGISDAAVDDVTREVLARYLRVANGRRHQDQFANDFLLSLTSLVCAEHNRVHSRAGIRKNLPRL